jgi:DNA gyrase/topoisomerase IV subunit B
MLPSLQKVFTSNEAVFKSLILDAQARLKEKEDAKKDKDVIKSVTKRILLPQKLVVARDCNVTDRELFLVEGDSAAGTAKTARDRLYQEVLPLRGKIPNADKTKFSALLQNKEIQSIINAIGYNLQSETLDDIRVGKLVLLMDADPDGKHISSLILFFLKKYLPKLILSGRVFVVDSPLFVGSYKTKRVFGNSKDDIINVLPQAVITRLKGHGEASAEELKYYAMNPYTRKLIKITMQDVCIEGETND